jgi:hypothetical protein
LLLLLLLPLPLPPNIEMVRLRTCTIIRIGFVWPPALFGPFIYLIVFPRFLSCLLQ